MNEADIVRLDLPATYKYLHMLGPCLQSFLERVEDIPDREVVTYNVQLAVHEVCTNIVDHAYMGEPEGRINLSFALAQEPLRLVVELRDQGRVFNPDSVPPPDLEEAQVHGYGLFLVQSLMDDVVYVPQRGGNRWQLVKQLTF